MSQNPEEMTENWSEMVEQMNESVANSFEQNMKTQAAFMESWADAVEQSIPDEESMSEGLQGYNRAYEVWMDAAERILERSADAAQGEEVEPSEFRDIWLQSANEAFKEVMGTTAFAAGTGQLVESMMELRQEADEVSADTLEQLGFATRRDIDEVGERLLQVERRQHALEDDLERLERIEDQLDDIGGKLDRLADIEDDVENVQEEVEDVQDDVQDVQDEVEDVDEEVQDVEDQVEQLTEEE